MTTFSELIIAVPKMKLEMTFAFFYPILLTILLTLMICATSIVALQLFPSARKAIIAKDVFLFIMFALLEPFSESLSSDTVTFTFHALLTLLVYLIAMNPFYKQTASHAFKDQIFNRESDSSSDGDSVVWH